MLTLVYVCVFVGADFALPATSALARTFICRGTLDDHDDQGLAVTEKSLINSLTRQNKLKSSSTKNPTSVAMGGTISTQCSCWC